MTYLDTLVTGLVIGLVLFAMWRVGQLNPVGTGRLARRLGQVERRMTEFEGRMDGIEQSVIALAETGADTKIAIEAMRIELAGDRGVTERTWEAVDRLQKFFMEEGFKRITQR